MIKYVYVVVDLDTEAVMPQKAFVSVAKAQDYIDTVLGGSSVYAIMLLDLERW